MVCCRKPSMMTPAGTYQYMAPEVFDQKPYTCKVDIWSAGVLLYVMLSGVLPWDESSEIRLVRSIQRAEIKFEEDPWPNISQEAKDLISSMLMKEPEQRITLSFILQHPWLYQAKDHFFLPNVQTKLRLEVLKKKKSKWNLSGWYVKESIIGE